LTRIWDGREEERVVKGREVKGKKWKER